MQHWLTSWCMCTPSKNSGSRLREHSESLAWTLMRRRWGGMGWEYTGNLTGNTVTTLTTNILSRTETIETISIQSAQQSQNPKLCHRNCVIEAQCPHQGGYTTHSARTSRRNRRRHSLGRQAYTQVLHPSGPLGLSPIDNHVTVAVVVKGTVDKKVGVAF